MKRDKTLFRPPVAPVVPAASVKALCASAGGREAYENWALFLGEDENQWLPMHRQEVATAVIMENRRDVVRQQVREEFAEHGSAVVSYAGNRWALLAQDPQRNDHLRVTWFDQDGFSCHDTVQDLRAALASAFDAGEIRLASRDTLDRLALTDRFQHGCNRLEEGRKANDSRAAAPVPELPAPGL
ncbi:hypothetical protein [Geopseudomonas aromaticivorans]